MRNSAVLTEGMDVPDSGQQAQYGRLRVGLSATIAALMAYCVYRLQAEEIVNVGCAISIIVASLAPSYLWASGAVRGLPIVPVHLATIVWTYGLPLVSGHPEVATFEPDEIILSTLCVLLYCACVTAVWVLLLRGSLPTPRSFRVLPAERGYSVLLAGLAAGAIYNILFIGQVIALDSGISTIVRSTLIAVTSIALFVLSVRIGQGRLTPSQKVAAYVMAVIFMITQAASLLLVASMVSAVALAVGYSMGGRRIPWGSVMVALAIFLVLHLGKGEMREEYWYPEPQPVPLTIYPQFFGQWFRAGIEELAKPDELKETQPIYERISLMHLLLLSQHLSPDSIPYLEGESYVSVLRGLVPRFLDPDKPSTHDSTRLLSLHYGLQTEQAQESTQIGWGYLNEGYANFGVGGVALVALFIGGLLAFVTRHAVAAPFMSLQNLLGVMLMVIAVQTDFSMAVMVAATFQSFVGVLLLSPFFERRRAATVATRP